MTNLSKQKVIEYIKKNFSVSEQWGEEWGVDPSELISEIESGNLDADPPPQAHLTIYEQSKKYRESENE